MDFDFLGFADSLARWIHVVAGILWIGLLYFFNWVNSAFAPTMDGDTKKKVIPELLPRTLFWFRWGAAFTWVFGVILMILIFYREPTVMFGAEAGEWSTIGVILVAFTFLSVFGYDILWKKVLKDPKVGFWAGLVLASAVTIAFSKLGKFESRAQMIHLGAMFGTFMAFNVWFRIWPAQQKIITAIKNGEKPDGDLAALAGSRSKHNTYMSVPLVFTMVNYHHQSWAATASDRWGGTDTILPLVILVGWVVTYLLYEKAKTVKGF